jgi:hypothetical protein
MRCQKFFVIIFLLLGVIVAPSAPPVALYSCAFTRSGWNSNDWVLVKSPRWEHFGQWLQKDDCIENKTPDMKEEDLLGKGASETYTSMVCGKSVQGDATITATMSFSHRMAPLIVIAPSLGQDDKGRKEYREHFEVVIFDQGVNVWHHFYKDKKPSWVKAAYCNMNLEKNKKYVLCVKKTGKQLSVTVDGRSFGYRDESLAEEYFIGITGCEGINRFFDFKIEKP